MHDQKVLAIAPDGTREVMLTLEDRPSGLGWLPDGDLLVVAMTSALFALGGFINAIFANNFDDISIIPNFILTPLTYLGGVFYSLDLLSEFWRTVTLVNPIVYMVNAFRYGVLGVSDVNVYASLAAIFAFTVVFFLLALWLLRRGTGIRG